MKLFKRKLISYLICFMIILSQVSLSLEKISSRKTKELSSKIEKSKYKKFNKAEMSQYTGTPTDQPTSLISPEDKLITPEIPNEFDSNWLKEKFETYEKNFEEHSQKNSYIYGTIMLVIGFMSNLPDTIIKKLDKFPGFKAALNLLKDLAILFSNVRPVTNECFNSYKQIKDFIPHPIVFDSKADKEKMNCESSVSNPSDSIKSFNEILYAAKMNLSKFYFEDYSKNQIKNLDSTQDNDTNNSNTNSNDNGSNNDDANNNNDESNNNENIASDSAFTKIKCKDIIKLRDENYFDTVVNDSSSPDNFSDKAFGFIANMHNRSILATANYKKKNVAELKVQFKKNKDEFFKEINFQTDLRIEAMVDPLNYMLTWTLLEVTLCPYKKYHIHIKALCFEAMLHRNHKLPDKPLTPRMSTEVNPNPEEILSHDAEKEFIEKTNNLNHKTADSDIRTILTKKFNTEDIIQIFGSGLYMKQNKFDDIVSDIKLEQLSSIDDINTTASTIREQYRKENWDNAELLDKLSDLEVVNYNLFSVEKRKDPSLLNKLYLKIEGFVDYSKSIVKKVFKTDKDIFPSNGAVVLPNLDLYTKGGKTKLEDLLEEVKKGILVGYQIWFRMLNISKSIAINDVFNKFVDTKCIIFENLPLFDLTQLVAQKMCFSKVKLKKKEEENSIFKRVDAFFSKIGSFIKILYNVYIDCINPLYHQFRDIKEYTSQFSKADFMKDFNKIKDELINSLTKNPLDYIANVKGLKEAGFSLETSKIIALGKHADTTLDELSNLPEINAKLEQLSNNVRIIILGKAPINKVDATNIEQVNKKLEFLKNESIKNKVKKIEEHQYDAEDPEIISEIVNHTLEEKFDDGSFYDELKDSIRSKSFNEMITKMNEAKHDGDPEDSDKTNEEDNKENDEQSLDFEDFDKILIEKAKKHLSQEDEFIDMIKERLVSNKQKKNQLDKVNDLITTESKNEIENMYNELKTDLSNAGDHALLLLSYLKHEFITNNPEEQIQAIVNLKSCIEILKNNSFDVVEISHHKKASTHKHAITFGINHSEFVSDNKSPMSKGLLDKNTNQLNYAAEKYTRKIKLFKSIFENFYSYERKIKENIKIRTVVAKSPKEVNSNNEAFSIGKQILNKIDRKSSKMQIVDLIAGPNSNTKQTTSNASRFKELSTTFSERKNKFRVKSRNKVKTHQFSMDPVRETFITNLIREKFIQYFENPDLIKAVYSFFFKISTSYQKLKKYELEHYEKIKKYHEVFEKVSLLLNSMGKVLPAGITELNNNLKSLLGFDCFWIEFLIKQLINVPVIKFLTIGWNIYKFVKLRSKIVDLIASMKKNSYPKKLFYAGQFISEVTNLVITINSSPSCKMPVFKSKRLMFKKRR